MVRDVENLFLKFSFKLQLGFNNQVLFVPGDSFLKTLF